jgi:organic radical activating enzyme
MYHIQLMLTKKCNKSCYYCTTHTVDSIEVDLDYLKWVLDQLPPSTGVELTGGEIGLIENINDIYQIVKDHPHIEYIAALSNGLLRSRGIDWIKDVEYWEHLIYEIKGREIIKFYNNLDLEQTHKYIIVTTDTTTHSLLANWNYFEKQGLFRPNFDYKIMNHKSQTDIKHYAYDLIKLYTKLNNVYFKKMITHYFTPSFMKEEKKLCQKWSPNTYIDLQTRKLGHCAMNVLTSNKVDFTKENLLMMVNGELSENDYCKKCYSFDNGKNRSMWNNRSYRQ